MAYFPSLSLHLPTICPSPQLVTHVFPDIYLLQGTTGIYMPESQSSTSLPVGARSPLPSDKLKLCGMRYPGKQESPFRTSPTAPHCPKSTIQREHLSWGQHPPPVHAHTRVRAHTRTHTCVHTCAHTHTHVRSHACTRTHARTRVYTCAHTMHTHTHACTRVHTCVHTHMHTHTRMHAQATTEGRETLGSRIPVLG